MNTTFEPLTREEVFAHKMNHETENPAIYLGTYRKYNCGDLYGRWIGISSNNRPRPESQTPKGARLSGTRPQTADRSC